VHSGNLNRPVPDVVTRECRRLTLAVVNFLTDVQGLAPGRIKCEFVQDSSKRLTLHAVYEVKWVDEDRYAAVMQGVYSGWTGGGAGMGSSAMLDPLKELEQQEAMDDDALYDNWGGSGSRARGAQLAPHGKKLFKSRVNHRASRMPGGAQAAAQRGGPSVTQMGQFLGDNARGDARLYKGLSQLSNTFSSLTAHEAKGGRVNWCQHTASQAHFTLLTCTSLSHALAHSPAPLALW